MKQITVIIIFIVLTFGFIGCSNQASEIVAKVNGNEITNEQHEARYQFIKNNYEIMTGTIINERNDKEIVNSLKDMALEDLIMQNLLEQKTRNYDLQVTEEEVDKSLQYIKDSRNATKENGYQKMLSNYNLTEEDLREELRFEELSMKLFDTITADVIIEDNDVKDYYGIKIFHIVVDQEQEANIILTKLNEGQEFAELAKTYSLCPSKEDGGDLGYVNENSNFDAIFKEAALSLNTNEITSEPVKTDFGYHIILAGNMVSTLDDLTEEKAAYILRDKQDQLFNKVLMETRETADIIDFRR
ncbi:hypothetical protein SYNTR_0429 [Candidatus Syntrophocurvum alkaliphilum]|uniref:PpiC domain-containing protein n=1 Tax=Candidatus Syntrophocurvum alkaliphilum TaxID=2293317 RepID=A0A6I6DE26_9FIRM|nr:SurA N-terminal domain-containing protein [Candidatus Syntrophocurvum alkaliphilum]QGT99022.1 hypothetical protein SYNTR_0429 [Candidatus Syntrophocurvum alkaliphilum]